MAPVDGYYFDPERQVFGFFQAKVRKELLTALEVELLLALSIKYKCEIKFFWRDYGHGMKFEFLTPVKSPLFSA
jgi:hypothetical protein